MKNSITYTLLMATFFFGMPKGIISQVTLTDSQISIRKDVPWADMHIRQSEEDIIGGTGGITFEQSSDPNDQWKIYHSGRFFSFAYGVNGGNRMAYIHELTGEYTLNSDRNLKKNIAPLTPILDKVMKLKPVDYYYKRQTGEGVKIIGLIAQEVKPLFPEIVKTGEDGYLGIGYGPTGVIAIKAIQEQQVLIEEQAEKINALETEITELKELMQAVIKGQNNPAEELKSSEVTLHKTASIKQNQPNPFTRNTIIEYDLPENIQTARLHITNVVGKLIKEIPLADRGIGQVELKSGTLPAGTYFYTLVADGQVVETMSMVIAHK